MNLWEIESLTQLETANSGKGNSVKIKSLEN